MMPAAPQPDIQPPTGPDTTSAGKVIRELGLAVGALVITFLVVICLGLLLTPFGVEKPGKMARK